MKPIFLVVGSPAVGKSTTSRALAARFPKSIHIPVDQLRDMVVSGLVLPDLVWSDELVAQFHLARQNVVQMALSYHQAGYAVVIDDFWDFNNAHDYRGLLENPALHKIVLYPAQAIAHQRNFQRSGDSPARAYIDEGINAVYEQLKPIVAQLPQQGWLVIDSSMLGVDDVVATIMQRTTGES